jgi:acetyl esterase/lipase
MKKFLFCLMLCALSLASSNQLLAQANGCGTGRYADENYTDSVVITNNIPFGSNRAVGTSGNVTLRLNFYEPKNDTASKRPLMIIAFGGSFISGDKTQVGFLCDAYTKMGYVCAAIDYRTGFFLPNEVNTTLAVVRAMHDMKAAVRFFRKEAATYKIDTDRIIVGGVSAGSIAAIHTAYLDNDNEIPAYLYANPSDTTGIGGVEGNSGNPGFSSAVAGVFNYSGAIGDTNWINTGDAPIIGFHDVGDNVVPFDTREVSVSGVPTGLIASGSRDLHARLTNLDVVNELNTYPGNGHVAYAQSDLPNLLEKTKTFMFDNVTCKQSTGIAKINKAEPKINLYPNPSTGILYVESFTESNKPYTLRVFDAKGKMVLNAENQTSKNNELQLNLTAGIYRVMVQYNDNNLATFSRNVLFQ